MAPGLIFRGIFCINAIRTSIFGAQDQCADQQTNFTAFLFL